MVQILPRMTDISLQRTTTRGIQGGASSLNYHQRLAYISTQFATQATHLPPSNLQVTAFAKRHNNNLGFFVLFCFLMVQFSGKSKWVKIKHRYNNTVTFF